MAGAPVKTRPSNLPAELTSFVGRRKELSEVKRLLTQTRLLTLTGSGGVGKTRLALRAAADLARGFRDGVWLVSLASIEDPQLVVQAVFSALGLHDTSSGWSLSILSQYLADKHLLLVLDNCEHLLDSCALLAVSLLKASPELRVLATSREALGATGETRLRVPPLSLPEDGAALTPLQIANYEAVALLSERAVAVLPSFRVDLANSAAVLRLCRRLDAIPLALELAAVRLEGLSVEQVVKGLEAERPVLATGSRGAEARQQTLEATIGWSYGLLNQHERLLWARLSVFAGDFDQEAAQQVCSDVELPVERILLELGTLVEKSILRREPAPEPARYSLLETLRQFGRQRLRERGDEQVQIQARHGDWVLQLAAGAGTWGGSQPETFNRLDLERNNLWAALDFCLRQPGQAARGIEICCHLYAYWNSRGPLNDARRVLGSLLDRVDGDSLARARGLWLAAGLAVWQSDYTEARRTAEESLRLGRLHGDEEVVAWALGHLGVLAWVEQRPADALPLLESAIEVATSNNDWPRVCWAKGVVCAVHLVAGDLERAKAAGEESVAMSLESGEMWARGIVLGFLAEARMRLGEWDRALADLREGVACKHALNDRIGLASRLETLAWMLAERGSAEPAAVLLGCAAVTREAIGPIFPAFTARHQKSLSDARARLGDPAYSAALERGRAMAADEAVAYALDRKKPTLESQAPRRGTPAKAGRATALTSRELEIARLIAEGMTSQQIAARLFISKRTVTTHVTNMLNKLGLSSRIQLAGWVAGAPEADGAPTT